MHWEAIFSFSEQARRAFARSSFTSMTADQHRIAGWVEWHLQHDPALSSLIAVQRLALREAARQASPCSPCSPEYSVSLFRTTLKPLWMECTAATRMRGLGFVLREAGVCLESPGPTACRKRFFAIPGQRLYSQRP